MTKDRLTIVFENENFCVVDKPACWLTTPSRDAREERPILGRILEKQLDIRLFPVHRLDYEVSGVVLWAKTEQAHRVSQQWFENSIIKKTYQAVSQAGSDFPLNEWQEWRSKLVRGKRRTFEADHGKLSMTRVRLLERGGDGWRWELCPLTGRPHQLRFEMYKHGYPILGDVLYSGRKTTQEGIALRAVRLDLSSIPIGERLGLPEEIEVPTLPPWTS